MAKAPADKNKLFGEMPIPKALYAMAVPTIISQLINLIYNMVDAFFIGRTGNAYMMAATSITLTLVLMNIALANLFGTGGGSLVARLMGAGRPDRAKQVSAFSVYGAILASLVYSGLVAAFNVPLLRFLGASENTLGFARQYSLVVTCLGSLPSILSMTLGHLLRNAGYSGKASFGLSGGGILNVVLDPLFMFVLLPPGNEVLGAAIATALSNLAACLYLLFAYHPMTWQQLVFLLLSGVGGAGGQFSITAAYAHAPAKEISVFDYSQVLFAALWGFLAWGEIPDYLSVIGYVIIIGVAVFRWWYNLKQEEPVTEVTT